VPAAAVIPALIAYIKVVAVKKLVAKAIRVNSEKVLLIGMIRMAFGHQIALNWVVWLAIIVNLEKIQPFKRGLCQ